MSNTTLVDTVADTSNVGIAFALCIGAGFSTTFGSAAVYFPKLVQLASKKFLAGALGLSGGVMIYVSFVEILVKAYDSFVESGVTEGTASLLATMTFFAGIAVYMLIDVLTHYLERGGIGGNSTPSCKRSDWLDNPKKEPSLSDTTHNHNSLELTAAVDSPVKTEGEVADVKITLKPAEEGEEGKRSSTNPDIPVADNASSNSNVDLDLLVVDPEEEKARLKQMGLKTAIAIAIHNFPEGLATFVATLDDPSVGATLAIAIAIHNVPEGLCVSIPIFYSTGDRHKAFLYGVLSGVSEPIGALLGWLILSDPSPVAFGTLFGVVGGMMVAIVLKELIPTAHRYDPTDTVVTKSVVLGMLIMALSLVLFVL